MTFVYRFAAAATLASAAVSLAAAQATTKHPNFAGRWELDVAHSDATQSTPSAATYVIAQRGDTLTYDRSSTSSRGTTDTHVALGLDGKPSRNTVAQNGADVATVSTVTWAHDTLVINSNGSMNGSDVNTYERWVLSADGRSLSMFREVTFGGQVYASTNLLFVRTGPMPTELSNSVTMGPGMVGRRTDQPKTPPRPDFTGVWSFDSARSEPSSFNPKSATWTVVQQGDSLMLDRVSPNGKQQATYSLNGAPRKFTLRLVGTETEATSIVTWNGASMVVHTTSHPGDIEVSQTDTWTLSADRKELRIKREANQNGGSIGAPTWVFVRM